jgi:hypothetical protein
MSRGLKPGFVVVPNVRAKALTYLRNNSNSNSTSHSNDKKRQQRQKQRQK